MMYTIVILINLDLAGANHSTQIQRTGVDSSARYGNSPDYYRCARLLIRNGVNIRVSITYWGGG